LDIRKILGGDLYILQVVKELGWELCPTFKYLKNPIYVGFIFGFIGSSLYKNSLFLLIIAISFYFLFIVFLAKFENREIN